MDDLVVCQRHESNTNPQLYDLVNKLQIHKCNKYCKRDYDQCRFQFPRPPFNRYYLDNSNGRSYYKQAFKHQWANNYNPYLIFMTQSSLNSIQANLVKDAMFYLAGYMSRVDSGVTIQRKKQMRMLLPILLAILCLLMLSVVHHKAIRRVRRIQPIDYE